jgi:hypothetical protein
MFIEFQDITFKNFLSYGNKPTSFDFRGGMNLITGTNGQGKCLDKKTEINIKMSKEIYELYINTIRKK